MKKAFLCSIILIIINTGCIYLPPKPFTSQEVTKLEKALKRWGLKSLVIRKDVIKKEYIEFLMGQMKTKDPFGLNISYIKKKWLLVLSVEAKKNNPQLDFGDAVIELDGKILDKMTKQEVEDYIKSQKFLAKKKITIKVAKFEDEKRVISCTVYAKKEGYTIPSIVLGSKKNVAFIYMAYFSMQTGRELKEALQILNKLNIHKVIIDLRSNIGGETHGCLDCVKLLCPSKQMFIRNRPLDCPEYVLEALKEWRGLYDYEEIKSHPQNEYKLKNKNRFKFVFLCGKNSASSAEIFLGFMKTYKVGPVVGEATFGKYYGQRGITLNKEKGYFVMLPVDEWFFPDNSTVKKTGIIPDKKITTEAEMKKFLHEYFDIK